MPIIQDNIPLQQIKFSVVSDFIEIHTYVWKANLVRRFFIHNDPQQNVGYGITW